MHRKDCKRLHTVGKQSARMVGSKRLHRMDHNNALQVSLSCLRKIRRTDGTDDSMDRSTPHRDHKPAHKPYTQPLRTVGMQSVRTVGTQLVHKAHNRAKLWITVQKYLLRQLLLPQKRRVRLMWTLKFDVSFLFS